jgi:hypothetical protein
VDNNKLQVIDFSFIINGGPISVELVAKIAFNIPTKNVNHIEINF